MSDKSIEQQLAELMAENAKLKAVVTKKTEMRFKVSEKGAMSVYGLQARFPVTLYRQQMERLLQAAPEILAFIKANESVLKTKDAV
jgi:hypothetical protein